MILKSKLIAMWLSHRGGCDWSLITGRGAPKREGGGACEMFPLRKGGQETF